MKTLTGSACFLILLLGVGGGRPLMQSCLLAQEPKERMILKGHAKPVQSVSFSPDGKTLASGSGDGAVKLWGVASGKCLATLEGHRQVVFSVAFSPDGKILASASSDGTVRLWDVKTREGKFVLKDDKGHFQPHSLSISSDSKLLACGSLVQETYLCLWDVTTGKKQASLEYVEDPVYSVAFSPDGKSLASGGKDQKVTLWDVASGKEKKVLPRQSGSIASVAFNPDGKTLASGGFDCTARLWDVASGENTATFNGHKNVVEVVAFSPSGRTLASGCRDGTVKLWDVKTRKEIAVLGAHRDDDLFAVVSVAFSPDGKTLAWVSRDTIKVWDVAGGRWADK